MPHSSRSTEITLSGMRFHARVGILPHERELAQPLEVDLRVRRTPDAAAVLDYRTLYALVADSVGTNALGFLEDLAADVLARALAIEGVAWARVSVRKPHVMLDGPLSHAEVAVEGGHD